ncbi:hypothetical protein GYMLUDRAFT_60234 [Collybiopsis luxurians FD-317 M1]|uniref:Protein kinase domain-containing protein n=1 Tax=Collybiopsis luxurians FD-317 M1 TaxID=944289 RepID=A0A0D0CLA4_9AGAR|nr:hypothetical protein GYMLUDRAFT_60234 [Collybiopsis luxurians FD-317 M1]
MVVFKSVFWVQIITFLGLFIVSPVQCAPPVKSLIPVFKTPITGLTPGPILSKKGKNNFGIYSISGNYNGHRGEDLILKVVRDTADYWGEVKALRHPEVDQFVGSGKMKISQDGKERAVIIMKKQPGMALEETEAFIKASDAEKLEMKKETVRLMCDQVGNLAVSPSRCFRDDNNLQGNVLVQVQGTKVVSVKLVDFGGESIYRVKADVKKEDVASTFCLSKLRRDMLMSCEGELLSRGVDSKKVI